MSQLWKLRVLLVLAVCSVTGAVLAVTTLERSDEQDAARQLSAGQAMLSSLVHSHSAVIEYADDLDVADLVVLGTERRIHAQAENEARAGANRARRESIRRQHRLGVAFYRAADASVAAARHGKVPTELLDEMSQHLHAFEQENEAYSRLIQREQSDAAAHARSLAAGLVIVLSLFFAVLGHVLLARSQRRQASAEARTRSRRAQQEEFGDVLQVTESEAEAYEVIKHHLERSVAAGTVTVMSRNNSHDRLEARTAIPDGSALAERLLDAQPRSCLAIRLGRPHVSGADEALLSCALCQGIGQTTCVPSLVGGEVIGSVLVQHPEPLTADDHAQIRSAVAQAAPALGNLRNLALAESRALTDALTGLPNTRAVYDTLKRMVAHANRAMTPLSAVMLDLDHFKQINDSLGHEKGDEALAAVGDVLGSSARASDFVGRYGGEEFLALLPDTAKDGAFEVAEKLRRAVERLHVPGTDRALTASCGVATFPDDAKTPDALLRLADRALYVAKSSGRNQTAEAVLDEQTTAVEA